MKKQTKIIGVIFSVILLTSILAMSGVFSLNNSDTNSNAPINYNSDVCRQIVRADGTIEPLECSSNLLTNAGKNAIRDSLSTSSGVPFSYIGLCNSSFGGSCTTPAVGDTTLGNEYTTSGLNRTNEATFLALGTGNWSYSRTFVASADNMVTNLTGIFNASTAGTMLAVNTFTTSTLQTNDQITLNWSIWIA